MAGADYLGASPTAATLLRSKYRQVDVAARQQELRGRRPPSLTALLTMPFARSWILHRRRREAKRPARRPIWVQVKPRRSANPSFEG